MDSSETPKTVEIPEFRHSPQQVAFLNCSARHKALSGGFGSGKTTCNVVQGIAYALENPGSRGMWVSRSHPMLGKTIVVQWEYWSRLLEVALGYSVVASYNKVEKRIELTNGSIIWMGSTDNPDSLLGSDLAWFGGDEIALWKRKAFDFMLDRLRQPGFEHRCWATYTPYGEGWWCELFEEGGAKRLGQCELFRISSHENPVVSTDYLESLESRYTGKWALQYIRGLPQEFEGLVWPGLGACEYDGELPTAWRWVVGGVDWGWTNPSTLLLLGEDTSGQIWAFGEDWDTMRHPEEMARVAAELQDVYPVEAWYCDPSEPGNIDKFRRAGLNARAADNAVVPGIATVSGIIDRGLRVVNCPRLLAESYCWEEKLDGTFKPDKPRKEDDHMSDCLRYTAHSRLAARPTELIGVPVSFDRA